MKRSRSRIATLGIFSVLGSLLIQPSLGEEAAKDDAGNDADSEVDALGTQFICQECAPIHRTSRKITVTEVSFLCDSQENNDDGSRYQDNLTCKAGDLAKTAVSFELRKWTEDSGDIYIDLNSTALGRKQRIYKNSDICRWANIAYWGDDDSTGDDMYAQARTTACPLRNGPYTFYSTFTVPSYSKDTDMDFTPDLRIEFFDEDRTQIGCVETGTLAEVSFGKGMERRGRQFFELSVMVFFLLSAFCVFGHRRRRKHGERTLRKKQASMMRRFHYIQTNRSGDLGLPPSLSYSFGSSSSSSRLSTVRTIPEAA